jgi:hypothetical protein
MPPRLKTLEERSLAIRSSFGLIGPPIGGSVSYSSDLGCLSQPTPILLDQDRGDPEGPASPLRSVVVHDDLPCSDDCDITEGANSDVVHSRARIGGVCALWQAMLLGG